MKTEPVALFAAIAVVVVTAASALGIVLETSTVETFIVDAVLIVTAVLQRSKVTPAALPPGK
jgi:hypothetical protein